MIKVKVFIWYRKDSVPQDFSEQGYLIPAEEHFGGDDVPGGDLQDILESHNLEPDDLIFVTAKGSGWYNIKDICRMRLLKGL